MYRRVKRTEEIDEFKVRSEAGKEYIIIQYQEYMKAGEGGNQKEEILGRKIFLTYNGALVNHIDTDTFEIFATKEIVRRV